MVHRVWTMWLVPIARHHPHSQQARCPSAWRHSTWIWEELQSPQNCWVPRSQWSINKNLVQNRNQTHWKCIFQSFRLIIKDVKPCWSSGCTSWTFQGVSMATHVIIPWTWAGTLWQSKFVQVVSTESRHNFPLYHILRFLVLILQGGHLLGLRSVIARCLKGNQDVSTQNTFYSKHLVIFFQKTFFCKVFEQNVFTQKTFVLEDFNDNNQWMRGPQIKRLKRDVCDFIRRIWVKVNI